MVRKKAHIPGRAIFIVGCIVGFAYCSVLIAITAAANYTPSDAVTVPSTIIYVVSIICYFLLLLFGKLRPPTPEDTHRQFFDVIDRSSLRDRDFTKDIFIPGSSGQAQLARKLREECTD